MSQHKLALAVGGWGDLRTYQSRGLSVTI